MEYLTDVIRTPSYNSTSFTPLENRLLSYHISDEDIDENGSPELIEIELELFISEENSSYIDLFIIDKNHVYILAWLTTDIDVEDPGQFNVTFKVAAQSFKDQSEIVIAGIASPLFDYYIIPMFDKIPYDKLSTFEPLIKYSVDDQLADTDNNGKNDSIRFNFHLISKVKTNVTLFTSFILSYEVEEAIPVYSNPKDVELIVGSNNFAIDFNAGILSARNLGGPYFLPAIGIINYDYWIYDYSPYVTNDYSISDFEPPDIYFTELLDIFDFENETEAGIKIIWEINVVEPTDAWFEFAISSYTSLEGYFYEFVVFNDSFSEGLSNITLFLDGKEIFRSKFIGDIEIVHASIFVENVSDEFDQDRVLLDFIYRAGVIEGIDYRNYSQFVEAYFTNISLELIDLDDNDLYDELLIETEVKVNQPAEYEFYIDLYSYSLYGGYLFNSTEINVTNPGNITIEFKFSAEDIVRAGVYGDIGGSISLSSYEEDWWSDYISLPSFNINLETMDYVLPVQLINLTDFALDNDENGWYDAIQLDFVLNVTETNSYNFTADVYIEIDYFNLFVCSVNTMNEFLTNGIRFVTLNIPADHFSKISDYLPEEDQEFEISLNRIQCSDEKGGFFLTTEPIILSNRYNLSKFEFLLTVAINFVEISLLDLTNDRIADTFKIDIELVINGYIDVLSIEILVNVTWGENSTLYSLIDYEDVSDIEVLQKTNHINFSKIFKSDEIPSNFTVLLSCKVSTIDDMLLDSYETLDSLYFDEVDIIISEPTPTDSSSSEVKTDLTISTTTTTTTTTTTSRKSAFSLPIFLVIITLIGISLIRRKR